MFLILSLGQQKNMKKIVKSVEIENPTPNPEKKNHIQVFHPRMLTRDLHKVLGCLHSFLQGSCYWKTWVRVFTIGNVRWDWT